MFKSIGILKQVGFYTAHVICSEDLNDYLRKLYTLYNFKCRKLLPPMNGSHITVNYSEKEHLKIEKEEIIEFEVIIDPQTNGNAWWYPIISKDLEAIRLNLGFAKTPEIDFHYCIGYERDGKNYL